MDNDAQQTRKATRVYIAQYSTHTHTHTHTHIPGLKTNKPNNSLCIAIGTVSVTHKNLPLKL